MLRWLFGSVMLALALAQAGAAIRALTLPTDASLLPPLEFTASGLWAAVFAVTAVRLRRGLPTHTAMLLLIGFGGYSILRLLIFARADYDRGRLPFAIFFWIVTTALYAFIRWRGIRSKRNDDKPQDRTSAPTA